MGGAKAFYFLRNHNVLDSSIKKTFIAHLDVSILFCLQIHTIKGNESVLGNTHMHTFSHPQCVFWHKNKLLYHTLLSKTCLFPLTKFFFIKSSSLWISGHKVYGFLQCHSNPSLAFQLPLKYASERLWAAIWCKKKCDRISYRNRTESAGSPVATCRQVIKHTNAHNFGANLPIVFARTDLGGQLTGNGLTLYLQTLVYIGIHVKYVQIQYYYCCRCELSLNPIII